MPTGVPAKYLSTHFVVTEPLFLTDDLAELLTLYGLSRRVARNTFLDYAVELVPAFERHKKLSDYSTGERVLILVALLATLAPTEQFQQRYRGVVFFNAMHALSVVNRQRAGALLRGRSADLDLLWMTNSGGKLEMGELAV